MAVHVAGGTVALVAGALAFAFRKGGRAHVQAGRAFVVGMLVLGTTAAILGPMQAEPGDGMVFAGVYVAYLVLTAWWTVRNRAARAGTWEAIAAVVALGCAALFVGHGVDVLGTNPSGMERSKAYASIFNGVVMLLAGVGDVAYLARRTLTRVQRLSRHLWRMCVAMFIATGSFFLGQQDVMPAVVRGSPVLMVLAFAPFALLAFWLVRVRMTSRYRASPSAAPQAGVTAVVSGIERG